MSYQAPPLRPKCNGCGAKIGKRHQDGCDIARCALCGGQLISCGCVYEVNSMPQASLEEDHPDIYSNGATEEMWLVYDAEVVKFGGPLVWDGAYPGTSEAAEFGLFSRWVSRATGRVIPFADGTPGKWQPCERDDVDAGPDLNRLVSIAVWSRDKRRWVLRELVHFMPRNGSATCDVKSPNEWSFTWANVTCPACLGTRDQEKRA